MSQWDNKLGALKEEVIEASSAKMTEMQTTFSNCIEEKLEQTNRDAQEIAEEYI